MEIELFREEFSPRCTLGTLVVNDEKFCDTIELVDKEYMRHQETPLLYSASDFQDCAIPLGTYNVRLVWSEIKSHYLPEIMGVPFHPFVFLTTGYTWRDCQGGIVIGEWKKCWQCIAHSLKYIDRLTAKINESQIITHQPITLTILWR